jgi:osmotically-inducible protein OsmY
MKFKLFLPAILGGLMMVAAPAQQPQEPQAAPVAQAENKDSEMALKIRENLTSDTTLSPEGKTVMVEVKDGKATLSGIVANDTEKRKIQSIAEAVAGAGNVTNKLDTKQ